MKWIKTDCVCVHWDSGQYSIFKDYPHFLLSGKVVTTYKLYRFTSPNSGNPKHLGNYHTLKAAKEAATRHFEENG